MLKKLLLVNHVEVNLKKRKILNFDKAKPTASHMVFNNYFTN